MKWWNDNSTVLAIGMGSLMLGYLIGLVVAENSYVPFFQIVLFIISIFFNSTYLRRLFFQ
jgi:hypothetical protein